MERITSLLFLLLRVVALACLAAAGFIAYQQLREFRAAPAVYPAGSTAAGLPIGGLTREAAVARLHQAYGRPIELRIDGQPIHLDPATAGFSLDLEAMLPPVGAPVWGEPGFWPAFWGYLMARPQAPVHTRLAYTYSSDSLRRYLAEELAPRYNRPAQGRRPLPASTQFLPGAAGQALDVDAALPLVAAALPELAPAAVDLPLRPVDPPPLALENLDILLRQIIAVSGFKGLAGVYLVDLARDETIHFAYRQGQSLPVAPDVAFTASSIIKIPVLVSLYRRLDAPPGPNTTALMQAMIASSSNEATDALVKQVIDEVRGPLLVSEDLKALGLENTFLAGYFELGAALLDRFFTPANQRLDVNTEPDIYNQATPSDIGRLLAAIYRCAEEGRGPLVETFPGELSAEECGQIIATLKLDRQAYLLSAGLPDGTPIAHKHGYGSVRDVITTIGDAGIIYSPGGDYVLVIFLNNPELLLWDPANALMTELSNAVYNYFNQ